MIGGIVANNSSGMCCGVKQNTYHTLQDMRVVLVDGTILDTADAASRAAFHESHAALLEGVAALASRVQADPPLMELIHKKYSIKNTTGYSINALADFPPSDPIEILKRLMIGSEGTLGFVSRVTYQARRMRTTCTPHAHRMHTACTPHAHCVHTACTLRAHRMHTACTHLRAGDRPHGHGGSEAPAQEGRCEGRALQTGQP